MTTLKEKILESAQSQMQMGGYESLNFGDIAAELNTTRANIHYHFSDKHSLAEAATENYIEQIQSQTDIFEKQYINDFIGYIKEFESWLRMYYQNSSNEMCICTQHLRFNSTPHDLVLRSKDFMKHRLSSFTKVARNSVKNGNLPKDTDPKEVAEQTMAMLMGQSQMYLFDQRFADKKWPSTSKWLERSLRQTS